MAYLLGGSPIRNPNSVEERNSTQVAQQRTLSGAVNRDYFGSNKRVWVLTYRIAKKADYDTIKAIYDAYLSSGTEVAWQVTETNYTVSATTVHVDLIERGFNVLGESYLSDFDLVLTEA